MTSKTVYLDNAATTPPLPTVIERVRDLYTTLYGNPSSTHKLGRQAQEVLEASHQELGRGFNVPPNHVVFTSGGTESNNLALWGGGLGGLVQAFQWLKSNGEGQLITSKVEHEATQKSFQALEQMGADVVWIDVDSECRLNMEQLEKALEKRTRFVSFIHAQNEVGTVQDIGAIGQLIRKKQPDAIFHVDAIQSFLKVPVDFNEHGIDLISISGHKIGSPKGIGALVLGPRFENRNPKIGSFIQGSGQQFGIRPGTVPVPTIAGLVEAIKWGAKHYQKNREHLISLRNKLISKLPKNALLNGPKDYDESTTARSPQTVNFSVLELPSSVLVEALSARGYCISAGSACHSTNPKPNQTIMSMGLGRERALSAVRVSFGHQNTSSEVDGLLKALNETLEQFA